MQKLIDSITALGTWLLNIVIELVRSLLVMSKDLFFWALEQVSDLALSAANQFDFSALDQYTQSWSHLPAEILNVMGLMRIGECMTIIVTALGIRLLMQLIPFVRLGS